MIVILGGCEEPFVEDVESQYNYVASTTSLDKERNNELIMREVYFLIKEDVCLFVFKGPPTARPICFFLAYLNQEQSYYVI